MSMVGTERAQDSLTPVSGDQMEPGGSRQNQLSATCSHMKRIKNYVRTSPSTIGAFKGGKSFASRHQSTRPVPDRVKGIIRPFPKILELFSGNGRKSWQMA